MSGTFRCATSDTRAVGDAERGLVLQARRGFDETGHLEDRDTMAGAFRAVQHVVICSPIEVQLGAAERAFFLFTSLS